MIPALQDAYVSAVEKAATSVVNIGSAAPWSGGPPWRQFPRRGVGSGIVYDDKGHILTNYHVIDEAERITVTTSDGRVLEGRVVGGDEETDVAVVKVDEPLEPSEFGDSDVLRVGQPVLAIGNPLGLAGGPTVTSGVVSALRRSLRRQYGNGLKVLQTDAAVNPGSSGGPLVDLEGQVVAITTATMPWAEGIGFAIPINDARRIAQELIEHGRVERAYLGISGYDVTGRLREYYGLSAKARGVFVTAVTSGSPADEAGIRVGDLITSVAGTPVDGLGELVAALGHRKVGETSEVEVDRQGRKMTVPIKLGVRPF